MDSIPPHIDPFRSAGTESLAEAFRRLEANPAIDQRRKDRVRAAVRMTGRLLAKAPAEISAVPSLLRQLRRLRHQPTGLAAHTLANCTTEIRFLLDGLGGDRRRSSLAPLSEPWQGVCDKLGQVPDRWRLSRLMAYASANGLTPEGINDAVIAQFAAALEACGEVDAVRSKVRMAIHAWNRLATSTPGGVLATLAIDKPQPKRWTIKPDQFPETFRQDVERWIERVSKVDPESEDGPVRPFRPATLTLHRYQLFTAASALVLSGRAIETVTSLAALVDVEGFRTLLRWLRERRGGEKRESIYKIGRTLASIARYHVGVDAKHYDRLRRICANIDPGETGFRSRTRARMAAFDDDKVLTALGELPKRLIEEAGAPRTSPRRARMLAQAAVAVEFLWFAPVRCANLAALNLETHVQPVTVGKETRWIVTFQRNETKNRQPVTYELPADSVALIKRAMRLYQQPNGWWFPDSTGGHKAPNVLGPLVKRVVEPRIGVPFNVHLFRALTGSLVVKADANGFETARALLGNRSARVVREHYTATAERHAIARAQENIRAARLRTAPVPAKGPEVR